MGNGDLTSIKTSKQPAIQTIKKRTFRNKAAVVSLFILLLPALVQLFIFHYLPMYGVIIAFEDFSPYKGYLNSDWVGFKNFLYFLQDSKFWEVMKNTLILNVYDILFGFTAPILFALLCNEILHGFSKRILQTVSYLPHFLSWVVVSGIFYNMLSPTTGMVNNILEQLFGIEPVYFMTEVGIFRGVLVIAEIWKNVGWSAILYFSIIAGIDTQLYDAAKVDGAGRFRQAIHITVPSMVPMIVMLLLLRLSNMFSIGFDRIFMLQNPLVYKVSDVISTYIFRLGLEEAQYSLTTAIGLVQSLLGFIMLVSANKLSKKIAKVGLY